MGVLSAMSRLLLLLLLVACEHKPADPLPIAKAGSSSVVNPAPATIEIPEVRVRANASTKVTLRWITPQGTAVNDDAPFRVRWNRSDGLAEAPADMKTTGSAVRDGLHVEVRPLAPTSTLGGELDIVVCDAANHSTCVPVKRSVDIGFVATNDATAEATVSIPLPAARSN